MRCYIKTQRVEIQSPHSLLTDNIVFLTRISEYLPSVLPSSNYALFYSISQFNQNNFWNTNLILSFWEVGFLCPRLTPATQYKPQTPVLKTTNSGQLHALSGWITDVFNFKVISIQSMKVSYPNSLLHC